MKILFFNTSYADISTITLQLAGSFHDLMIRYQARNVATIELRAAAGDYIDSEMQSSEYYRVIFKNDIGGTIHANGIAYFYVVKNGEDYCFVNRQTVYRPEQHTIH